jgi:phosphate transport system protein
MIKQLISIFRGESPLQTASTSFTRMMELTQAMLIDASAAYWSGNQGPEERTRLYEQDVQVNKLERTIRKQIVAHLSGPVPSDVPYGLLMMSLVKDVERLGDYAKNLSELPTFCPDPFPDDACTGELREITRAVETLTREGAQVFASADRERAKELTIEGRSVAKRCDTLVRNIAASEYSASLAVKMSLGTRFYKRIEGHLLNVLSGVIMPLHKLDYYDEKALER